MIIDIHNHADYWGYSAEKMLENMDSYGLDITCLLSWECPKNEYNPATKKCFSPFSDIPVPFERCVEYKRTAPDRFLLGYCPDPRDPDAIDRLKAMISLYDISICGELKLRMMYDNPDAIRLYRVCGEYGLPVLMHFDYSIEKPNYTYPWPSYWYGGGLDALERVLKLCPETNFIGHAPGFWAHISNDDQYDKVSYPRGEVIPGGKIEVLLEKHPNLYCDISAGSGHNALSRDLDFTKDFITKYQDRILYARDYFDNIHQELLESIGLSDSVKKKLYESNARRILRGGDRIPCNNKI